MLCGEKKSLIYVSLVKCLNDTSHDVSPPLRLLGIVEVKKKRVESVIFLHNCVDVEISGCVGTICAVDSSW